MDVRVPNCSAIHFPPPKTDCLSVSAGDKTESTSTRYRGGERHARLAAYRCKHHRIFDLKEIGGFRSHHELPLAG